MNNIKTFENFNNKDIFTYIKDKDVKSVENYIYSGYDGSVLIDRSFKNYELEDE